MPKERKTRSVSFERRSRGSPFPSGSSNCPKHRPSSSRNPPGSPSRTAAAKDIKEWEEVRCPVCMEHPHNAVLLLCSSHDKGCRPFMCDTSYRHSNCLDQFRKAFASSCTSQDNHKEQLPTELSCPLCRGFVSGWTVVEPARYYMNAKSRSCSMETCNFAGAYGELRKHARRDHPSVRPSVVDPARERDWRRMEQQRDFGDLLSTLMTAVGQRGTVERDDEYEENLFTFPSVAVYFVLRVRQHSGAENQRSPRHQPEQLTYSGPSSTISNDSDDGDDGRSEEVSAPSRGQGRPRRQLRMSDDEDEVL